MEINKILYGGDYNPEQWLKYPEILEQDIVMMKEAKINTVSLGIFSWSSLEPEEGKYTFEWMDEVIDRLYRNGISVILATPSGSKPKWMTDKYPEILRVDETRHRNLYGFRHNHCYTSPIYRQKVREMNTLLAKRYGDHPAVILWHISNEYGGECHCPLCQKAFQQWLQNKYTTIDVLNDKWCSTFWSHTYQSFEQIESPSPRGETFLHALNLDWKRFVTDQTVDFVKEEIKALRDAGSDKPATINMMYNYEGLNYHKFADIVDIVSWDTYPTWHKTEDRIIAMDNGMQHDIMRSIKKQPFILMESCPSSTNWQSVSKLKKPGMLSAASLQAIAHGSQSVLYFQIRQSQGASEKFHGAVIDHYGGSDTRMFKEVSQIGTQLEAATELVDTMVKSQVAVIYDWENRWAMEDAQGPRNKGLYYKEAVEKSYYAFRKQGLNVDVIDMDQDFDGYKIVAAPMTYMYRPGYAEKVRAFVEAGGRYIATYWAGIVDETDRCYLGGTPHGLLDVIGLRSTEIDGLYDGETNQCIPNTQAAFATQKSYECRNLCELVVTTTAEPLMTYGEDFYAGTPVVTKNAYGDGVAYYIGADVEQQCYDDCYKMVAEDAGVKSPIDGIIPEGVEVTTRVKGDTEYVIAQNFTTEDQDINLGEGVLILGESHSKISKYDTIILKR